MPIAYINGKFIPRDQATVSIMDRGFLFADGIYEVIPVFSSKPFRLDEHLQRLENSLKYISIDNPLSQEEWRNIITLLVQKNKGEHQAIYLQVTRGAFEQRTHEHKHQQNPTIIAFSNPVSNPHETKARPLAAITCNDIRWKRCDIKSISLLPNILMKQQAADAGADEAILLRDGLLTEGAASNVFIVNKGAIATPPKSQFILGGITRDLVIELLRESTMEITEREIKASELSQCDEIWLTSSTKEVSPVIQLDGKRVGAGKAGPVWQQFIALYSEYKQKFYNIDDN